MNSGENNNAHQTEPPRKDAQEDAHVSKIEEGLLPASSSNVAVKHTGKKCQGTIGKVLLSGNLDPLNGSVESTDGDDLKNFRSCRDGLDLDNEESKPRDKLLFQSSRNTGVYLGNANEIHDESEVPDEDLRGQVDDLREQVALLRKSSDKIKNDIKKIDGQPLLPEDSYSFLAITRHDTSCKNPGVSFIWAILIFWFQILTLTLLAVDVIDLKNGDNKLGIPGNVDWQVRIAQLIAIIITVISQDEVRQSFNVIYDGYDRSTVEKAFFNEDGNECSGEGRSDRVMRARWYAASLFRLVEGCLALGVTFMLVVRATTVRDLLLNFTAVEFVSSVDDAVFLLSKWGYFGEIMSDDADSIANARLDESKGERGRQFPRTAFLIAIFLGMLGPWLYLSYRQEEGVYLNTIIYVQFGDDFNSALGTFSGVYEAEIPSPLRLFSGRRLDYISADRSARFSYCPSLRYWAFLYGDDRNDDSLKECWNETMIRARSSESYAFDITETASDQWFVKDERNYRQVPLLHFSLSARKMVFDQTCNTAKDVDEGGRFICTSDGVWACNPNWFGVNCQFEAPCDFLEINGRYASFADDRGWSFGYKLAVDTSNTPIQVYGRPAYIENGTQNKYVRDLMFFTGRRWVLTNTDLIKDLNLKNTTNLTETETLISDYITNHFHAHWSEFEVVFISEAVDIDTPADGPTPVGLSWFRARKARSSNRTVFTPLQAPDINQDQEAVFLCATCNAASNPCLLGGACSKNNNTRCDCITGSSGTLCQIAPTGDGRCNHYFNTEGYGWDGGDCCPETCKSAKYKCGTNESSVFGFLLEEYIGFPHCLDPSQRCDDEDPCWKSLVDLQGTVEGSEAGKFVAISGNGAVVAMSSLEQGSIVVRVLEQDGKEWKTRGEPLKQASRSWSRSLQTGDEVNSSPLVDVVSLVALSEDGSTVAFIANATMHIYHWVAADESWTVANRDCVLITECSDIPVKSLALSSNGMVLAVDRVSGEDGNAVHYVELYKYYPVDTWSLFYSEIKFESPNMIGVFLSLSSSGHILAMGHALSNKRIAVYEINVKDWNNPTATPIGPPLPGKIGIDSLDSYSVSLSSDGKILAVGSPNETIVRVYFYNSTSMSWTPIGNDIRSSDGSKDDVPSKFGASVSLSGNGTIVAVGVPYPDGVNDHVEVFAFDGDSWNLYGSTLRKANNDGSGTAVSLSRDGSVLVFGAPEFDREEFGMARVTWNTKTSVKNSSQTFAVTDAPLTETDITVEIQLDTSPWEIGMSLTCNDVLYGSISHGSLVSAQASETRDQTIRVPKYSFCTFEITDFKGDGIRREKKGFYKIYYGTEKIETALLAKGGELFGSLEQITFKVEPPSLVPIHVNIELDTSSSLASAGIFLGCGHLGKNILTLQALPGTFAKSVNHHSASFLLPKGTGCLFSLHRFDDNIPGGGSFKIYGNEQSNPLQKGELNDAGDFFVVSGCKACECAPLSIPLPPETCQIGEALLRVELQTNENGADASWDVSDDASFESSTGRMHFREPCSTFTNQTCVPDNKCSHYIVANTPIYAGGEVNFTVLHGNVTVANITNFLGYVQETVGDCSELPTMSPDITVCKDDEALVNITLTMDRFPQDISWELYDNTERRRLLKSEDYRSEKFFATTVSKAICVAKDSCMIFTIQDLAGNGLCCDAGNGSVVVSFDSGVVADASDFIWEYTENFGNCDVVPSMTMPPTSYPTIFRPAECDLGFTSLYFEINMDGKPHEIEWHLDYEIGSTQGFAYDRFTDAFQTFPYQECVPDDACIKFYIYDDGEDGLCCNYGLGSYSLYFGDSLIGFGSDFGARDDLQFQCDTPTPTIAPTRSPWDPGNSIDCGPGFMLLRVEILLDVFPAETTWKITVGSQDGNMFLEGGPYEGVDASQFIDAETCIPDDSLEFTFVINDSYGDGICCSNGNGLFNIYLHNDIIHKGRGDFGSQQVIHYNEWDGAVSRMPVGTPMPLSLYPTMIPYPTTEPQIEVQSSICPSTQPGSDDFCSEEGLACAYGEKCCCDGQCYKSLLCVCSGESWECVDIDACSNSECPPTPIPSMTISAPPEPDT